MVQSQQAEQGRFQPITDPAQVGAGTKYYCWVHAGELLTAFYVNNEVPDGRDPKEKWEVSPYGKRGLLTVFFKFSYGTVRFNVRLSCASFRCIRVLIP